MRQFTDHTRSSCIRMNLCVKTETYRLKKGRRCAYISGTGKGKELSRTKSYPSRRDVTVGSQCGKNAEFYTDRCNDRFVQKRLKLTHLKPTLSDSISPGIFRFDFSPFLCEDHFRRPPLPFPISPQHVYLQEDASVRNDSPRRKARCWSIGSSSHAH